MLFLRSQWPGLADGSITLTFRRWKRPQARAGGTALTPVGVLAIESVDVVPVESITDEEARRAGHADRAALIAGLGLEPGTAVHRVAFHMAGPDPRERLREEPPSAEELTDLATRLGRMDARAADGPWTAATLRAIADAPGARAADLAAALGRERAPFKADVRRLKTLGLTESLEVGYRLSPRGRAVLDHLEGPGTVSPG